MKLTLNIGYNVEDEDPEKEQIADEMIAAEVDAFVVNLRRRLEDAGLRIEAVNETRS